MTWWPHSRSKVSGTKASPIPSIRWPGQPLHGASRCSVPPRTDSSSWTPPLGESHDICIRSFNSRVRDECLNQHWFLNLDDARKILQECRVSYDTARPHRALNGLTPQEYLEQLEPPSLNRPSAHDWTSDGATRRTRGDRGGVGGTPRPRAEQTGPARSWVLGLAELYVSDERFARNHGAATGAAFVRRAIRAFAERNLLNRTSDG